MSTDTDTRETMDISDPEHPLFHVYCIPPSGQLYLWATVLYSEMADAIAARKSIAGCDFIVVPEVPDHPGG